MASDLGKSISLESQPDEGEPDSERLSLQAQRAELVGADPVLLGMQMGWVILAAVYGVGRKERQ